MVLETDAEGKVNLGPLEDIEYIYSIVSGQQTHVNADNRRWHILQSHPIQYQPTFTILQN